MANDSSRLHLSATGRRQRSRYPFSAQTNVGRQRALNEDSILALPPLFAVADGLGGHEAGEVASALAIDTLRDHAPRAVNTPALVRAVHAANGAIMQAAEGGIGHTGMGSTMTAIMVEHGKAAIAQVGDSRAYLLRSHRLSQITEDHSVVAALLRSGHITAEEARFHPQRSVITRALGSDPNLIVDHFELTVLRGDRLLLCSDGLTSMVDDTHIAAILNGKLDPQQTAAALIEAANKAGGADNISAIVIDIDEDAPAIGPKRRSKLWIWALIWTLLAVAVVGGVAFGIDRYTRNSSYLEVNSAGLVTVNQGVPGRLLSYSFTYKSDVTTVAASMLAPSDQTTLKQRPSFHTMSEAYDALDKMVQTSPILQEQKTQDNLDLSLPETQGQAGSAHGAGASGGGSSSPAQSATP